MIKDYKTKKIYYPMLVSKEAEREDKKDEFLILWKQFDFLPQGIKEIISSEKLVDFIYGISQHFNLNETETEEFSRTIRRYFFGEIADGQFARIVGELCKTSTEEGLAILKSIKNIRSEGEMRRNLITGELNPVQNSIPNFSQFSKPAVQTLKPTPKPMTKFYSSQNKQVFSTPSKPIFNSNFSQMPVRRAMKLFPKLELQVFTETPILSKKYLKPIKPTIKNWIMVYEDFMGAGKKTAIERGNFLFQSDATKNLNTEEKQKLAFLLKSMDEDFALTIDRNKGEVVFETKSELFSNSSFSNSNEETESDNRSFKNVNSQNLESNNFQKDFSNDFSSENEKENDNSYLTENQTEIDENEDLERNNLNELVSSNQAETLASENLNQSVNNFSFGDETNFSKEDLIKNEIELLKKETSSADFSDLNNSSQKNSQLNFSAQNSFQNQENLNNQFISPSNFNAQVFSNLSQADFSKISVPKKENQDFKANYSIDDLYKNKNSNLNNLAENNFQIDSDLDFENNSNSSFNSQSNFSQSKNQNFDDLSFNPNQNEEISDDSLSFTSNHVLPVEKSLLEKQRAE